MKPRLHVRHLAHRELGPLALLVHGYGEGGHLWYETCAALAGLSPISVLDLRGATGTLRPSAPITLLELREMLPTSATR